MRVVKVVVIVFAAPMAPLRTSSMALACAGWNCSRYAIMNFTRLVCVVRIMRRHSSAITAIGFSQSTWTPARAASTAKSQCIELGAVR